MADRSAGVLCVLFTDLVSSTELMARVGDAAFDVLRSEHFTLLGEVVSSHGGQEVKNTGDGVMATFSSVVAALTAAVAMQQATYRQGRRAQEALSLRVGLSIGEVAVDGGDVFGTPVVEAARLVAAARSGQILCTALVRAMAGSRTGVPFAEVAPLQLKGLAEPVAVCTVAWEPPADAPATVVPLPPLLLSGGRIFVGRDEELERLRQQWKEVAAGGRRLLLVGGEPGVGKTRLATELARGLHDAGAVVLAGRCDEDLGVPYQPFVEALRHYVVHAASPRLGRHGGELSRLVPELPQLVPGLPDPLRSDPETERYRLFDAVAAWLADVSGQAPVLLVVDDLQWAAKPTLLLLRHVLRSPEPVGVLVVATYRDTDVGRGHPLAALLADVPRLEGAERLPLTGLDVPAVTAFLEQAAGHGLDGAGDELARVVWRETEGNALFVAEVLRHLVESKAVEERDGRWVLTEAIDDLGIPEGVRDVVGRRLSRLSDDANRVLACASVFGVEFEPSVVQAAGGFAEETVLSAVEEGVASRLLVDVPGAVPRNRFAHALIRATLYDELTAARRVALHRKAAEAIEARYAGRLDDHLPALAHHWARAAAPSAETDPAVDYAIRAGDRALAQLAHDEAVTYYRSALDLLDTTGLPDGDGRRLNLCIALGEAQRLAGDPAHRETLLDAARSAQQRGDAHALARAALANNRGFHSMTGRVDAERVSALEAALIALPPGDSPWRARLLAGLANELGWSGEHDRRLGAAVEALAMARRLDDPATLAHVLLLRWCALPPFDPARLASEMDELEALALKLGDPALACWAALYAALSALILGDRARFDAAVVAGAERTRESGQPFLDWVMTMVLGCRDLLSGRLPEAEARAREAFEIGLAAGIPDAGIVRGTQRVWIGSEQGRWDDVVDSLSRAAARPGPDPLTTAALALALADAGRLDDARTVLEPMVADGFGRLPGNYCALYGLTLVAGACARTGHREASAALYDRLLPHRLLVAHAGPTGSGCVAHFLGMLATATGRFDDADRHFRDAVDVNERMGAPIWLARTRLEWAATLLRRAGTGDAGRARELLCQALGTAVELGLAGVERRARTLLETAP